MKKYSAIHEQTMSYEPLHEGQMRDFFKLTKDKYFSNTYILSNYNFNHIKYNFAYNLLNDCKKMKFRKFDKTLLSKFAFSPEKVLKQMVDDLLIILEKQKGSKNSKIVGLPSFNFHIYYNENKRDSLLKHCVNVMTDIQDYFLKHYIPTLEKIYDIDYKKDLESFDSYKNMSLDLFKTAFDKKEKKFNFSLQSFTPKSKYEKLAKNILDWYKSKYGIDIEYSFLGDDKMFNTSSSKEDIPIQKPDITTDKEVQSVKVTNYAKDSEGSKKQGVEVEVDRKENISGGKPSPIIKQNLSVGDVRQKVLGHINYNKIVNKLTEKINSKIKESSDYKDFNIITYTRSGKLDIQTFKKIFEDTFISYLNDVSNVNNLPIEVIMDSVKFIEDRVDWGNLGVMVDTIVDDVAQEIQEYIKK
jgi:hypothetical protein